MPTMGLLPAPRKPWTPAEKEKKPLKIGHSAKTGSSDIKLVHPVRFCMWTNVDDNFLST